jgi:hypothetical protein
MLLPPSEIREVRGLSAEQSAAIRAFLQGAVYCWCKTRPRVWFSLRDLMGGENLLWNGTPLIFLQRKYEGRATDPLSAASRDGGFLLKRVLQEDRRTFETDTASVLRKYRWTGDEDFIGALQ